MVSIQERNRRYQALSNLMQNSGYGALILAGQAEAMQRGYIRYVADWRLWGGKGFAVLPVEDEPVLILGTGSQPYWAKTVGWVDDVRATADLIGEVASTLEGLGLAQSQIGVVGMGNVMTYDDVQELEHQLPGTRLIDATTAVDDIMAVKSEEELAAAKDTSQRVTQAHATLRATLVPGMTEREWMATATHKLAELGCLDGIAHLTHEIRPFFRPPTERKIKRNDFLKVSLEFAGPSGFWIEQSGVYSFEEPPTRLRRYYDTTMKAIDNVKTMLRPGVTGGDVTRTIEATYHNDGWTITGRGLWDGHLIGLNVIRPPHGLIDSTDSFKENMIFNIHPGLLVDDDELGMFLQDNLVVTPNGGQSLDSQEHEWHVVPSG